MVIIPCFFALGRLCFGFSSYKTKLGGRAL